ncbi:MAG: DUF452 family protein [Paludibacteraceae bacterium]|nr:DUF452 family protein [Paludibacteraceae bacterium]MBN2788026.1 DUF452 family protein [Paludibacteraceae bacterium]
MKISWLHKNNNTALIVFLNGWGMDEQAVNHLQAGDFDICMLNDFNGVSNIDNLTEGYKDIYLVAWSMGVWAAGNAFSPAIKIKKAIAINGTQKPMDDNFGIPVAIFKHTLETWNETNRNKFNMRILGGRANFENLQSVLPIRSMENQQAELQYIKESIEKGETQEIQFDTVLIGNQDLIFSPVNQQNYWQDRSKMVLLDMPHYPFASFNSWKEIIEI